MVVNLIGAVFILPFMLFSATAGQLADKYEKSRLIRLIKLFEIAIMVIGLAGFCRTEHRAAVRRAGAARRPLDAVRSGQVRDPAAAPATDELVGGNGMVEMGTFVAILLGTIAGGLVVAIRPHGPLLAGGLAIAIAVAGWLVSRAHPAHAGGRRRNSRSTGTRSPRRGRTSSSRSGNIVVWRSMLGISWFWFYGAIYLAQLPVFTQRVLGGDEHVFTLLLATFSVGIGVGSLLCERLSGRKVEIGLVPFGSIGLTLFAIDLWLATRGACAATRGRCRGRSWPTARTGASPPTSCCSACSAASTSCRCTR